MFLLMIVAPFPNFDVWGVGCIVGRGSGWGKRGWGLGAEGEVEGGEVVYFYVHQVGGDAAGEGVAAEV